MYDSVLALLGDNTKQFDENLLPSDSIFGYFRTLTTQYHTALKGIHKQEISYSTLFLDSADVNAYSLIHSNMLYACMNSGTILKLSDFYYKMWATPLMFPNIGKCKPLEELVTGEPLVIKNGVRYQTNDIDDNRKKKAEGMATIAIAFIVMHELSHLYNGHNAFLKDKRGLQFLNMLPTNIRDMNIERCLLEMDADSSAIRLLIMFGYLDEAYLSRYMTEKDAAVQFFITAISLLFRFLHINNPEIDTTRNYLPIPFRLLTIYDELMRVRMMVNTEVSRPIFFPEKSEEYCEGYLNQIEENVSYIINDVFMFGNEAFVDILEDEELCQLYYGIRKDWPNLRNELIPYSIMPLTTDYIL